MNEHNAVRHLERENEDLRTQLQHAQRSLGAIRSGEVDALVIPTARGQVVFTRQGAERVYRILIEQMNEGAVSLDCEGGVLYSNQRFAAMVQAPLEQVVGRSIYNWVAPQDHKSVQALLQREHYQTGRKEVILRRADGSVVAANLSVSSLRECEGPVCFCMAATDLTDQNRARAALEESERKYRQLHEAMIDGFVRFDEAGAVKEFNESFRSMLGYEWDELLRLTDGAITPDRFHDFEAGVVECQVLVRGYSDVYEKGYLRKDKGIVPVELRTYLARDNAGNPNGRWAVVRDIRQRKREEEELRLSKERLAVALKALREQATHDALTGVFNRAAILQIVDREIARCERDGSAPCIAIADVDHFKSVNDSHGHAVGDEVLREIVGRLRAQLRPYDSVGRYGGEEFLIVAPNCTPTHGLTLAERLRACVADEPVATAAGAISVSISLGLATSDGNLNVDALFELADRALYRAKQNGRNRVEVARSIGVGVQHRDGPAFDPSMPLVRNLDRPSPGAPCDNCA